MRRRRAAVAPIAILLVLTACTTPGDKSASEAGGSSSASASASRAATAPGEADTTTTIRAVPRGQWRRMVDTGMVRTGCPVTVREQLRRVDLPYVDFGGDTRRGHLIVRRDTAASVARIFTSLFETGFPIAKMRGVDWYDGDSDASLRANNTAAYNCRRPDQINAPTMESPHANGRAVDINPLQNPWRDLRCDCWSPSPRYAARAPGPGRILRGDPVWRLFVDEGWFWQNIKVPDYMHFDTGYPSAPLGAQ